MKYIEGIVLIPLIAGLLVILPLIIKYIILNWGELLYSLLLSRPRPKFKKGDIVAINHEGKAHGINTHVKILEVTDNHWVGNGYTVFLNNCNINETIHEKWLELKKGA